MMMLGRAINLYCDLLKQTIHKAQKEIKISNAQKVSKLLMTSKSIKEIKVEEGKDFKVENKEDKMKND